MGDFTHYTKCAEREKNYFFLSYGHPQQKVLEVKKEWCFLAAKVESTLQILSYKDGEGT